MISTKYMPDIQYATSVSWFSGITNLMERGKSCLVPPMPANYFLSSRYIFAAIFDDSCRGNRVWRVTGWPSWLCDDEETLGWIHIFHLLRINNIWQGYSCKWQLAHMRFDVFPNKRNGRFTCFTIMRGCLTYKAVWTLCRSLQILNNAQ